MKIREFNIYEQLIKIKKKRHRTKNTVYLADGAMNEDDSDK